MKLILWLISAATAIGADNFSYWVQPCTPEIASESACKSDDPELAQWALHAWELAAGSALAFPAAPQDHARIRIYWASARMRLYGEARPIMVEGKRGAAIYVNADVTGLGEEISHAGEHDPVLRAAIVYLTCLHESGHALGLSHTGRFEDIMYSFGYGGDIPTYFDRYRRLLHARADIRVHSGLSVHDRKRLLDLFGSLPDAALR